MKKHIVAFLAIAVLGWEGISWGGQDDGVFTVKQYNFKADVQSINETESALNRSSAWDGIPTVHSYNSIAFIQALPDDVDVHFRAEMVSFPHSCGTSGSFALKITGSVFFPEAGYWTMACGSDDGFKVTISGQGSSQTFTYSKGRRFDTSLKSFLIPKAGEYAIRVVYFTIGTLEMVAPSWDAAALELSMAKGSFSSFNSSAFSLVRASSGAEAYEVSFDANDGGGEMETQMFVEGEKQALFPNTFKREGYTFVGWAKTVDGEKVYGDGEEIEVTEDMTLYAVWKRNGGALTLQVERAEPAAGSLTLAWTEEVPVEGVKYSVYRGTGEERSAAVLVKSGLTGTSWTDTEYWVAEPTLDPLKYWVVADDGGEGERESNWVETRHRYGVFVGVGTYKSSNSPDPSDISNAELFARLAREQGGFTVKVIPGTGAKKKTVRQTIQSLAGQMQTGDYAALFFSSHGDDTLWKRIRNWMDSDVKLNFASVALYDGDYEKKELASDLEKLLEGKNGVGVVVVLNSCLSGGAVDAVSAEGQIGWITSCKDGEITPSWTSSLGTPLPQFLLEYGWNRGMAGSGEFVTFGELADYALPALRAFLERTYWVNHPVVKGERVLEHFVAGRHGSAVHATGPSVPSGVDATMDEAKLHVSWDGQSDADWFILQRSTVPETTEIVGVLKGNSKGGPDPSADLYGKSYFYRVAAMNEWGISGWSDSATGSRHNPELVEWVKQQCDCGESASPATLAAAAALSSANGASYEACYVAEIDPNDPNAAFEADLVREDGKWQVKPMGGTKEGRVYHVEGKKEMSDEVWTDVTDVEDLAAEGWRFFRVGVELAE